MTKANGFLPACIGSEEIGLKSLLLSIKNLIIQLGIIKIASSTEVKGILSIASHSVL